MSSTSSLSEQNAVWPKDRNEVIATPVIYHDRIYIGNGQDPEHGEGVGHFYVIDPTKRGDITQTGKIWHADIRRTIATASVYNDLVFVTDFSGFLHCFDTSTGKEYWTHDLASAVWGSPMIIDGKIYVGNQDGDVYIMQASKEKKELARINMGNGVTATVVPAHGTLFLDTQSDLYALSNNATASR